MLTAETGQSLIKGRGAETAPLRESVMKVQIVRDTVAGKKPVFVGEVVELPELEARELIVMKKAVVFAEPAFIPSPSPEKDGGEIETADLKPAGVETTAKVRGKRKE